MIWLDLELKSSELRCVERLGLAGIRARKIGTLACGRGPGLGQAHPLQEEIAAIAPSMDRIRRGWDCEDDEKETSQRLEAGFPAPHGTDADSTVQEFLAGAASPKEFPLLVAVRNHMGPGADVFMRCLAADQTLQGESLMFTAVAGNWTTVDFSRKCATTRESRLALRAGYRGLDIRTRSTKCGGGLPGSSTTASC